jgi:solute carrier family 34 (sodium-dependent phosphate cotransporter)
VSRIDEGAAEAAAPAAAERSPLHRTTHALWWTARFALALYVFVGALQLMKTGAASLSILQEGGILVANAGSTLGLGWLGALLVLSGSPIAATSLTLVAGGGLSELQGFTMLTGSRLGAAFVVLVTAVIFAFRAPDGERRAPITTAMFALFATALVYIPAAFIGAALLRWDTFHSIDFSLPQSFVDLIDVAYSWIVDPAEDWPAALVFLGGLGCLLVAFKLIDTVLPPLDSTGLQKRSHWMLRKWPMFLIGCAVALVTMSVSVALALLVPLVAKRYVKVQDTLPYILGANITTLGDTMLAAFALDSPEAVRIVLAEVIATTALTLVLLTFFYMHVLKAMWHLQVLSGRTPQRLIAFTAVLFAIPIVIIGVSASFG